MKRKSNSKTLAKSLRFLETNSFECEKKINKRTSGTSEWTNNWTNEHTKLKPRSSHHAGTLQHRTDGECKCSTLQAKLPNTHRSVQISNHVRRLRSDSESQRHIVHVEHDHPNILLAALRNTRQTCRSGKKRTRPTSFCDMVAVKERHLGTRLHPHFVLFKTTFGKRLPGRTLQDNLKQ